MKATWMSAVAAAALLVGTISVNAQVPAEKRDDGGATTTQQSRPETGAQQRPDTGSDARGAGSAQRQESAPGAQRPGSAGTKASPSEQDTGVRSAGGKGDAESRGSNEKAQTQTQGSDKARTQTTQPTDRDAAQTRDRDNQPRAGDRDRDTKQRAGDRDRDTKQRAGDRDRDSQQRAGDRDRDRDGQQRAGDRDRDRDGQRAGARDGDGERRDGQAQDDRDRGDRQDRTAGDRQGGGDRVQFSERERTTIRESVDVNARVTNVNFNVSVGATVPRNVTLRALPPTIVEINPTYRNYRYVVVQDEIVIINPQTYRVVEVVPLEGRTQTRAVRSGSGSGGTTVQLNTQQRQRILSYARSECQTVLAEPEFDLAVGVRIPERVELCPFEDTVVREVDVVQPYRFIIVRDQVVLVDPSDHTIVEVIR